MEKKKSFTIIYADILILPKMEKEKLFTIIYADILIFANLCQFLPMPMLPKMEKGGCH